MPARPVARSFALATLAAAALAQEPERLTLATVLARGPALHAPLPQVLWLPAGHDPVVLLTGPDGNQTAHRFADGKVQDPPLADAARLWQALGETRPGPARFPACTFVDATTLRIEHAHRVFHWKIGDERAAPVLAWDPPVAGEAPRHAIAPGDGHVAWIARHQLFLADRAGRRRQLTFDGTPELVYGDAAHRAEFGIQRGLFWSADGRFLAFSREDQRAIAPYPYQDLDADPPAPVPGRYPMAGRAHARVRIGVCDTTTGSLCWLDADPDEDVYWTNVTFGPGPSLCVARVGRGQDHLDLVRYDATTGKRLATLLSEQDREWIEPEHGPHFLADGRFLWWSARDGHRHLYLHGPEGNLLQQVTKGAFDVQRLCGTSSDAAIVWFQASGEDPRQLHLFAAKLDGSEVRQVTRERGTHEASLSPDAAVAFVTWSNLETRPTARLLDLGTGTVIALGQAADPLAKFALPTHRLFQVTTEGDAVLYGHLMLPPGLADGQKCPLLLYVYGGPHVQLVTDQWAGGAPLWLQAFAAEGYVVCQLDNRGTPNRGIEFEQSVFRRLGSIEVDDQLRAIEWCKQQAFVDPTRIGVHGWSYGGYLTLRLLLKAPEVFACGVSGAPVTDWAMYETGYTERYMDTPAENADGYAASSCLPLAGQLKRPLLIVQGSDDRTVMWSHTLRFLDRCIEAGVTPEYFVYPGAQHGLDGRDKVHFLKLLHGWLGKHLMPAASAAASAAVPGAATTAPGK